MIEILAAFVAGHLFAAAVGRVIDDILADRIQGVVPCEKPDRKKIDDARLAAKIRGEHIAP